MYFLLHEKQMRPFRTDVGSGAAMGKMGVWETVNRKQCQRGGLPESRSTRDAVREFEDEA
jgi:hypothetical protein